MGPWKDKDFSKKYTPMGKGAAPEQKEAVQRNAICNLGMVKLFKFYYFLLKLLNFIREACQKKQAENGLLSQSGCHGISLTFMDDFHR